MSALPEAKLAREAELAYQMICMATDYDGWHATNATVDVPMVMAHLQANSGNASRFLGTVLDELCRGEDVEGEDGGKEGKRDEGEGKEGEEMERAEMRDLVRGKHCEGATRLATGMTGSSARKKEALEKLNWLFPGSFES